jgi:hypothetical protein
VKIAIKILSRVLFTHGKEHQELRRAWLILYYLAIIAGLIAIYGRGNFSTPPFVYQGF